MVPPMADMFRTIHDMQKGHKSYAVDYVTAIFRLLGMVSWVVFRFYFCSQPQEFKKNEYKKLC